MPRHSLSAADTSVLILAGGRGSRLQPVLPNSPKALAPINTQPFLLLLTQYLASHGFQNLILCTGYKSSIIQQALDTWSLPSHLNIQISEEPEPRGTAGAIKQAERHIHSDNFIVINGDTFINIDYNQLLHCFTASDAIATLTLYPTKNHDASGSISINQDNVITSFQEKVPQSSTPYINAGVYLFYHDVLKLITPNANVSLEHTTLPRLIKTYPQRMKGFVWSGDFIDIGTPNNYQAAQQFLQKYQLSVHS